jgi:hypothetical protein
MKRFFGIALGVTALLLAAGLAWAQMGGGMGGGMRGGGMMGPGMMGQGMMGSGPGAQPGQPGCPGMTSSAPSGAPAQITEDNARQLAQQYADQHLRGFTVDKVLPFTGMHGTMYSVELKGADGQIRTFHVSPWGAVMPFGGPQRTAL